MSVVLGRTTGRLHRQLHPIRLSVDSSLYKSVAKVRSGDRLGKAQCGRDRRQAALGPQACRQAVLGRHGAERPGQRGNPGCCD